MQEHPYFGRPMIFYGSVQQEDEDEIDEENEMNFSDLMSIYGLETSMNISHVGLVFHYTDSDSEIHFT